MVIPCTLPGLNDIIKTSRIHFVVANSFKKKWQKLISQHILISKIPKITKSVHIDFFWYERNMRRDIDNISSGGRKFILDALVNMERLPDDSQKWIKGFTDHFMPITKTNPRVEVFIREFE